MNDLIESLIGESLNRGEEKLVQAVIDSYVTLAVADRKLADKVLSRLRNMTITTNSNTRKQGR